MAAHLEQQQGPQPQQQQQQQQQQTPVQLLLQQRLSPGHLMLQGPVYVMQGLQIRQQECC
jgi:hypothetical protein